MPALLHEQEVTAKAGSLGGQVDKAFAVAWQDDTRLLVGTKCNKLLQWDTAAGSLRSVPLPAAPPRQHAPLETIWGSCGIHTVAVNPAGDMVATGGSEPSDCAVLRLPDFQPVQTLVGHQDWLFGAAWVSDRHLVTGSRDQCVALWSLPEAGSGAAEAQYQEAAPKPGAAGLQRKFEGKVRDVKYDFASCRLAALSTEPQGCVKLLDAARGLRTVRTLQLQHTKELVCMEQRADLLAVGSMGHVQLLDPRRRNPEVRAVASPDDNQGVRSVQLTDHLLSFGTGRGKLFFWDLRAGGFVPTETARFDYGSGGLHCKLAPQPAAAWAPRQHLQLGSGLVQKNDLYWEHFAGMDVKHACYAHLWDASRTRLFVCGGPLAFGLAGCYMAVWH
ncbi:hypothetical protein COHA_007629 [Chlorella ohadii]|uniref:DDB1- and CUL4-associated factor 12 beta-propeller domain-containing protein n=1 Tax=Chlorella ohadii TaxID=2649997 RepID=A0AAD5DIE2_9CHLO|nr:hypothetical protein COHA_007629 [Chlorella ohadii]